MTSTPRDSGRSPRLGPAVAAGLAGALVAASVCGAQGLLPTCPLDDQPMTAAPPSLVGVCTKELNPDNPELPDMAEVAGRLAAADVVWAGNKVHWEKLEPAPGELHWQLYDPRFETLLDRGLTPVVTLRGTAPWASSRPDAPAPWLYPPADLDDWRAFVARVVARYSPRIRHWEIWNEPNQPDFFRGSVEDYLALLDAAHGVIRQLAPEARVWAPAVILHPWSANAHAYLETVIQDGSFDVLSIHLYFFDDAAAVEAVTEVRALLDLYGKGAVPLRVTETNRVDSIVDCHGFNAWPGARHADNLAATFACLANAGADAVLWFKSTDTGQWCDGETLRNGLLDPGLQPKAPYLRLQSIAGELVRRARIFADGFESGDLDRWSWRGP